MIGSAAFCSLASSALLSVPVLTTCGLNASLANACGDNCLASSGFSLNSSAIGDAPIPGKPSALILACASVGDMSRKERMIGTSCVPLGKRGPTGSMSPNCAYLLGCIALLSGPNTSWFWNSPNTSLLALLSAEFTKPPGGLAANSYACLY